MSEIPHARPEGRDMRSDVFADDKLGDLVSPSSLFELRRGSLRFDPACLAVAGAASEGWWSQTGSNRRPHACKARALPAELWPRTRRRMPKVACLAVARVNEARLRPSARQPSPRFAREGWWAWEDLNFRPHAYQARALTN
jgi:hypothetical protein